MSGQALYDLKAWIVWRCNLMQALPDRRQTVKALEGLDLVVSIDVLPAEICGWSDVVLPEATYLERDDDVAGPVQRPFLAVRQEVPPLHDSKPGWWIAKELAGRVARGALPVEGRARVRGRAAPRGRSRAVAARGETGVVLGREVATCEEEGLAVAISTESGKIQLRSEELARLGFDPLPPVHRARSRRPGPVAQAAPRRTRSGAR